MNPQPQEAGNSITQGSQFVDYAKKGIQATEPNNIISGVPENVPPISGTPNFQAQKRGGGYRWLFILMVVLIVLLAGGVGAYAFLIRPEAVIPGIFNKIDKSKKIHNTTSINMKGGYLEGGGLSVISDVDRTQASNLKSNFNITVSYSGFSLNIESRILDNTVYVSGIPAEYLSYLDVPKSQWYSIKLSTLEKVAKDYGSATGGMAISSSSPLYGGSIPVAETFKDMIKAGVISKMKFTGISMNGAKLVKNYELIVSKDGLATYIMNKSSLVAENEIESKAYVLGVLAMFDFSPVHLSVDLFTGALLGIKAEIDINMPSYAMRSATDRGIQAEGNRSKVSFISEYSYSDSGPIVVPDQAVPLDDIYFRSLESAKSKGKNSRIISSVQQIRTQLEVDYDGGYKSCNTAEIKVLKSDIESHGGTFICRLDSSRYLVAAKLIDTGDPKSGYFCLDSRGRTLMSNKLPSGYACQ